MDGMSRFFGENELRPDHPDFWRLSSVVLKYDGRVQDAVAAGRKGEEVVGEAIDEYVDQGSLAYMALQRSMRILGITTAGQVAAQAELLSKMATLYTDAFVMGCAYQESKASR